MAVLNEQLSDWSGVHCWCGRYEYYQNRNAYRAEKPSGGWRWDNTGTCTRCGDLYSATWDLSQNPYQNLRAVPTAEWDQSLVRNSCFYQEAPRDGTGRGWNANGFRTIMPADVTGVEFLGCNLDNCRLPAGATMMEQDGVPTCSRRKLRVQNDRRDWLLDGAGEPTEPTGRREAREDGSNVDPAELPGTPITDEHHEAEKARAKRVRDRRREGLRRAREEGAIHCECVVGYRPRFATLRRVDMAKPAEATRANEACPSCHGRGYRHPLTPPGELA